MSSTINGKSTSVIKHFRSKPAALAIYWIYCARQNNEGVAWPSLRGLQRDTGWSYNTCQAARTWLEEHRAIEPVKDYTRPDWRALPVDDLTQRQNLDQTHYYRVTGVLMVDSVAHPMLYVNEEQSDGLDEKALHDSPDASWMASDIAPHESELNTIEKPELPTTEKHSAPNGAVEAEPPTPQPDPVEEPAAKPAQPHIAIIDAWYEGMPAAPVTRKYPRNVATAKRILDAGYTPDAVRDFVTDRYTDPFWHDKAMTLEYVEDNLPLWVESHAPPTPVAAQQPGESAQDKTENFANAPVGSWFERGAERALATMERAVKHGA